jgi:hypothetical protein
MPAAHNQPHVYTIALLWRRLLPCRLPLQGQAFARSVGVAACLAPSRQRRERLPFVLKSSSDGWLIRSPSRPWGVGCAADVRTARLFAPLLLCCYCIFVCIRWKACCSGPLGPLSRPVESINAYPVIKPLLCHLTAVLLVTVTPLTLDFGDGVMTWLWSPEESWLLGVNAVIGTGYQYFQS